MSSSRTLDLLLRISTQGNEALGQIQAQIQTIAATPFNFGGAIDSIRQLTAEFQKLSGTAEQNQAAIAGSKVAAEAAKAQQQLSKAVGENEKAAQQAARAEVERLKTQKEAIAVDQQTIKLETEKARSIKETANAEAAQERAQQAAIRTERLKNQPEKKESGLFGSLTNIVPEIALVSAAFNQVTQALGTVQQVGKQVFDGLIAQNVQLREQIQGIAASLSNNLQVKVDGKEITDPIEGIKATLPLVNKQIEKLRDDSLLLNKVTSDQLISSFATVAQNVNSLNINLDQARQLTTKLTAASTTLNLTEQQRQIYIDQIARGQIDSYNLLAKGIGLTSANQPQLIAQGRFFEFIDEKTKGLVAGQALVATGFNSVLSNIVEVFDRIRQAAGEPLLDAILPPINNLFALLQKVQPQITEFAKGLSTGFVSIVSSIIGPLTTQLQPAFEAFGRLFSTIGQLFTDFSRNQGPAIGQFFGTISQLFGSVLNAAIVGVVDTFNLLAKVLDVIVSSPITAFLTQEITGALGAVNTAISAIVNTVSSATSGILQELGTAFDAISETQRNLVGAVKPLVEAFQELQAVLKAFGIGTVLDDLVKLGSVLPPLTSGIQLFGDALKIVFVGTAQDVLNVFNGLLKFVGGVTTKIKEVVSGLVDNPAFQALAKVVGVNIDEVRKSLEKLDQQASQGDGLKKVGDEAEKTGQKVEFANKALIKLGTTSEQLRSQLEGAFRDLQNPQKAEEAAKRIGDLTQKALENGVISREQAVANLKQVQNNTGLQVETQINAQKAITKILQDNGQERLDAIKTREKQEEDAIKAGTVSKIAGERELTKLKQEELDKQIAISQAALDREDAEGRGLGPAATKLRNQLQQQQADREALIEDGKQKEAAAVETGLEEQNKILSDKRAEGLLTEAEFGKQSIDLINKRGEAQKAELERQRGLLKPDDKEGQSAIDAKEAALSESLIKQREQVVKEASQDEIDAVKSRENLIQESVKAGRLSQIEGDKQLTAAKLEELDKQSEAIKKQLEQVPANSPEGKRLLRQQAELEAQKTEVTEKGNRDRARAELVAADQEVAILEGRRVRGLLSEESFADQSLAITKRRIDLEQKELERQRALLKPGDAAGQREIDAAEASLNTKREQAEEQFQARKLAIVERAQKKAEDAAKLSEISRNTEVDKLLAARQIREVDADLLRVQNSRQTIAKELQLEKDKTAALQKLPALSDPVKEEERQQRIRASRIKTAELTDNLVKNEIEQQQALFRVVSDRLDRQVQATETAAKQQVTSLQGQLKAQEALTASIDNQNRLLQARKGLQDALSGYAQTEVSLLAGTAKTEQEKQTVAELTAAIKLRALQQQQVYERESLENEIQKNKLAIDNEKIQNRIAQLQGNADVLKAQAELQKAQADPNRTKESVAAAAATVDAARASVVGLQLQGLLIDEKGQTQDVAANFDRRRLAVKQQGESDQARGELINALPESFKESAQFTFQQDLLRRSGLGVNSIGSVNTDQISLAALRRGGVGNFGLPGALNPSTPNDQIAVNPQIEALRQQLNTLVPTTGQTAIAPITNAGNSPQLQATLDRLNKAIEAGQTRPVEATVNNSIAGPDANMVADLVTRRTTDTLISVLGRVK